MYKSSKLQKSANPCKPCSLYSFQIKNDVCIRQIKRRTLHPSRQNAPGRKGNSMIQNQRCFPEKQVFFTSDTHFFHARIIKHAGRPFGSVDEMNDTLIRNWNRIVPKDGFVFHLGDFCLGTVYEWNSILDQLNSGWKSVDDIKPFPATGSRRSAHENVATLGPHSYNA